MRQQYKVIESSIIDSMQSLDNIFSNEFCKVSILQQEKVIKGISQELERLKDTLEQNKLDFLERQAEPTSFEYGKTEFYSIKIWNEINNTTLESIFMLQLNIKETNKALKKAEYILNSTGFNHAMIFNCNESLQIERKGENVEIVRHFEKAKNA